MKKIVKKIILKFINFLGISSEKIGAPKREMTLNNWIKNTYKTYSPNFRNISRTKYSRK